MLLLGSHFPYAKAHKKVSRYLYLPIVSNKRRRPVNVRIHGTEPSRIPPPNNIVYALTYFCYEMKIAEQTFFK